MANVKITDLPEATDVAEDDQVLIIDVSDDSSGPSGTDKRSVLANLSKLLFKYDVENLSDLESSTPTISGLRAICRGNNDANYISMNESYSASKGDVTASNGRIWRLVTRDPLNVDFFESFGEAVDRAISDGVGFLKIEGDSYSIQEEVDMRGVGIKGSSTEIINSRRLLNCGPLINCIVAGFRTDVDYISPVDISSGKTTKALYRLNDGTRDELHVFTKNRTRGYTRFTHSYGLHGSGSTDTGGSCENWRSTYINLVSECYLMIRNSTRESGGWDDFSDTLTSRSFPDGSNGGMPLQYKGAQGATSEIEYTVYSDKIGRKGVVAFYATESSTQNAEIIVNGVSQRNINLKLVDDNYIVLVEYELTKVGDNTILIDKPGAGQLYVIGVEFTTLANANPNVDYDYMAYSFWPYPYVNSTGAQDYAIFTKDAQKWMGSYHGGETARFPAVFNVDGIEYSAPENDGEFILGESISIEQSTTLAVGDNSLDCDSKWYYINDSVQVFDCTMEGSANAEFFYTTMTTTSDDFDDTRYPYKTDVSEGSERFGRYNKVVQANESTLFPMQVTTYFTLFPMGGEHGINADHNGVRVFGSEGRYNKVYYGPVTNSEVTITKIGFSNVKVFE